MAEHGNVADHGEYPLNEFELVTGEAVALAGRANVRQLLVHHHLPERNDDDLDRIERRLRTVRPEARLARQDMTLAIDPA